MKEEHRPIYYGKLELYRQPLFGSAGFASLPVGPGFHRPLSEESPWKDLPFACDLCHVKDSAPYYITRGRDGVVHVVHHACADAAVGKLNWPRVAA